MTEPVVVAPKRPREPGWVQIPFHGLPGLKSLGYPIEAWRHAKSGLSVLSAVEVAHDPGTPDLGPEYHISVSLSGERCSSAEALWVLHQFDLDDAKEDNHVPNGKVRNYWRPVADNLSGFECRCVGDEPAMREDKGDFTWRGVTK